MTDFTPFLEETQRIKGHAAEIYAAGLTCNGTVTIRCAAADCTTLATWPCAEPNSLEARLRGWRYAGFDSWKCPEHAAAAGLTGIEAPF